MSASWNRSVRLADADGDPDYGEGDTSTEEDAAFRKRIEDQDSSIEVREGYDLGGEG